MKDLISLSKYILFEISQCLILEDTIRFSGVCKKIQNIIHYKNAAGEYIYLKKDDYLNNVLIKSCRRNKLHTASILLKAGADINYQNRYGFTAVAMACIRGRYLMAKLLLEAGANFNIPIKDIYGNTPLLRAVAMKVHTNIIELLLEYGVDINFRDDDGHTTLTWAINNRKTEVFEFLLKNGAEL